MQRLTDEPASPIPFISVDRSNALWTEGTLDNMGNISF